jgi:hypothetical protein
MGPCELRYNAVLGSSVPEFGTLQRQKGDVILLLPARPNEGVELLQEEGRATLEGGI